jgi:hypothetical protein
MEGSFDNPSFREVQRFRQGSPWGLIGTVALVIVGLLGLGLFVKVMPGRPEGIALPALLAGLGILTGIALVWLMYAAQLVTEVRPTGLYVQFYPFHWSFQKIDLRNFSRVEVVTYRPLRDYGGWGIRYGRAGKAYNVSGDRGVKLIPLSGRSLMIGSQRPEELAGALQQFLQR